MSRSKLEKTCNKKISFTSILLYCTFFAGGVFFLNAIIPSYLNGFPVPGKLNFDLSLLIDNPRSSTLLQHRLATPEFARRPVVYLLQLQLQKWSMTPAASFLLIQALGFIAFVSLLVKEMRPSTKGEALLFVACLSLVFSNLFAFAASICTYDDFLQYTFVVLAMKMFWNKRVLASAGFIFVACVCRESTLLLIPFLIYLTYFQQRRRFYDTLVWVLPAILYFTFLHFWLDSDLTHKTYSQLGGTRFSYLGKNILAIRETSVAVLLVIAIPVLFVVMKFRRNKKQSENHLAVAFLFTLGLTIFICFISTIAREARYYFLPLIPIFPWIRDEIIKGVEQIKIRLSLVYLRSWGVSVIMAFVISYCWYSPNLGGTGVLFRLYAMLYFTFFFYLVGIYSSDSVDPDGIGLGSLTEMEVDAH